MGRSRCPQMADFAHRVPVGQIIDGRETGQAGLRDADCQGIDRWSVVRGDYRDVI